MRLLTILFLTLIPLNAFAFIPESQEIAFDIYRNGEKFGTHTLQFQEKENGQTEVKININMRYCLGPVCLFRYEHQNTEIWQNDRILSMVSETYDDGDDYAVQAYWDKSMVDVTTIDNQFDASPDIFTTSYWNSVVLRQSQLLNTQKGNIEDIQIENLGVYEVSTAFGDVQANAYKIDASVPITIFYDTKTRQWVGLEFSVRDSKIVYQLVSPVEVANK